MSKTSFKIGDLFYANQIGILYKIIRNNKYRYRIYWLKAQISLNYSEMSLATFDKIYSV